MTLQPLLQASFPIPWHALFAFVAVVVGAIQLATPKGTQRHKILGYSWVTMMLFVAGSGFFIYEIRLWGMFSPIHLLSAFTICMVAAAVLAVRTGNIRRHKRIMVSLFFLALILTGAFTFFPGRIMYQVIAGP